MQNCDAATLAHRHSLCKSFIITVTAFNVVESTECSIAICIHSDLKIHRAFKQKTMEYLSSMVHTLIAAASLSDAALRSPHMSLQLPIWTVLRLPWNWSVNSALGLTFACRDQMKGQAEPTLHFILKILKTHFQRENDEFVAVAQSFDARVAGRF